MLTISDLFTPLDAAGYMAKALSLGAGLGLKTTSWVSGGVTRTILAIVSAIAAGQDTIVSVFAQAGFLDTAAAVTPEYGPGWLDAVAQSLFDETRSEASKAGGDLSLVNASASSYGPFAAGTFHVQNPTTKATYVNAASLTIAPSTTTVAAFTADSAGSASTSGPGTVTGIVTSCIGVTCTNASSWVGADTDTNAQLVAKCRLKLATLTQRGGPGDAYEYFALNADKYLPAGTLAGGRITRARALLDPSSGVVHLYLANASGAPVGGDVTAVDGVIADECTPDDVTEVTAAASALAVTVAGTLFCPSSRVAAVTAGLPTVLAAYFSTLAIGGTVISGPNGKLSYEALLGALWEAFPYLLDASTLTLNGAAADVTLTPSQVATLTLGTITVTGV